MNLHRRHGEPAAGEQTAPGHSPEGSPGTVFGQAERESSSIASWPLQSHLELGALPSAVPCARLHARRLMWEWGMTDLGETVELIVSELATNAVRASRDAGDRAGWDEGAGLGYIRLRLHSDKLQVLVDVWDRNPQRPHAAAADSNAESGRGLFLVEAISDRWGYYFPADQPTADDVPAQGKVVWALVGTALLNIPRQPTRHSKHPALT
jgi:anti-sigma regulatory factor (Ser/Thr protein kinase)